MALPTFSMRQLLEAGVHFGHHTRRWNPKMAPYIFGVRNGIHIIDLEQTEPMLYQGLQAIRDVVAGGGRVLLVGTKRQAQEPVAEAAKRCGQYYVNYRWLGGMLTNFKTISASIRRLRELEERITQEQTGLTKRELLELTRDRDKLERALGGIKEMGGLPDILFVIDTNKEAIAVREANTLRIPVVAILDSNSSPDGIAYPIDLSFRFLPTVGRDFGTTLDAQRARGFALDKLRGGIFGKIVRLAPLVVPLVIGSIVGAEDIINAMELRCFGVVKRTWLTELRTSRSDKIVMALCIAWFVGITVLNILGNYTTGFWHFLHTQGIPAIHL